MDAPPCWGEHCLDRSVLFAGDGISDALFVDWCLDRDVVVVDDVILVLFRSLLPLFSTLPVFVIRIIFFIAVSNSASAPKSKLTPGKAWFILWKSSLKSSLPLKSKFSSSFWNCSISFCTDLSLMSAAAAVSKKSVGGGGGGSGPNIGALVLFPSEVLLPDVANSCSHLDK